MQIPNYGWVVILLIVAGVAFAAGGYSTQALVKPAPVEVKTVPVYVTVYPTAPPVQYSAPVATQATRVQTTVATTTVTTQKRAQQSLWGSSDDVQSFQITESGIVIFTMKYTGDHNFILWLKDADGNNRELLANEIGYYEGKKSTRLTPGLYYFDVKASGPWVVTF